LAAARDKNFEHDCHHHDEPIGPAFETLEIFIFVTLLKRADMAIFNSNKVIGCGAFFADP
jgi:hypothetical protein